MNLARGPIFLLVHYFSLILDLTHDFVTVTLFFDKHVVRVGIVVIKGILFDQLSLLDASLGFDINYKLRTLINLTLRCYRPAHLLDDFLTNGQSQTCTLSISLRIFLQLTKVNEQFLETLFR